MSRHDSAYLALATIYLMAAATAALHADFFQAVYDFAACALYWVIVGRFPWPPGPPPAGTAVLPRPPEGRDAEGNPPSQS